MPDAEDKQPELVVEDRPRQFLSRRILRRARRRRVTLAWSVWVIAVIFVSFQFLLQLSSGQMISGLMRSFMLTALGGAVLTSSYYYIYTLLQVPAGMLMDRFGPRGVLSVGAAVVCIGSLLFAWSKVLWVALIARILMGSGASFAFVGCISLIAIWFPVKRFAMMAGIVETVGMLGTIFGTIWLADYMHAHSWRGSMVLAGVIAGVLSVFLFLMIRNTPRRKHFPIKLTGVPFWTGFKRLIRNPLIWLNGMYTGLMFSVVTVFAALWAVPFIELSHHVGLFKASSIASVLYIGIAVGGPLMGWLDGATDWRRPLMIINAILTTIFLSMVMFWISLPLYAVPILFFLTGLCVSSYVLSFAIASELATPANRSTSIGLTNMLCVVFAPILQPLVGWLIVNLDDHPMIRHGVSRSVAHFEWAVSIVPLLVLVAAMCAYYLPAKKRR